MAQKHYEPTTNNPDIERPKAKAAYNFYRRVRAQKEEREFQQALDNGTPFEFIDELENDVETARERLDASSTQEFADREREEDNKKGKTK